MWRRALWITSFVIAALLTCWTGLSGRPAPSYTGRHHRWRIHAAVWVCIRWNMTRQQPQEQKNMKKAHNWTKALITCILNIFKHWQDTGMLQRRRICCRVYFIFKVFLIALHALKSRRQNLEIICWVNRRLSECVCVCVSGLSTTACQCFSHAFDCYYDPEVEKRRASLDTFGRYRGGGVCIDCQVRNEYQV